MSSDITILKMIALVIIINLPTLLGEFLSNDPKHTAHFVK